MTDTNTETTTPSTNIEASPASSPTIDMASIIPDDLKNEPSLASIKEVGALVKGYVAAQKMIGSSIRIPTTEASKEAFDEFYTKLQSVPNIVRVPAEDDPEFDKNVSPLYDKLGRPSDPSKYKLEVPEGIEVDSEYLKSMTSIAHKAGLTQRQMKALADAEFAQLKEQTTYIESQKTAHQEFLKKEWGNAFDSNTKLATSVLSKFTEKYPEHVQSLINTGLATNPVIRLLAVELGRAYQETGSIALEDGISGGRTPEMARDEINDIMSNKSHAYHNLNDPSHEAAVLKVNKLYQDAYPEPKARA